MKFEKMNSKTLVKSKTSNKLFFFAAHDAQFQKGFLA
jgi:hypothetical protein